VADSQRRRRQAPPAPGLVGVAALALLGLVALASRAHRVPGGPGSAHAPPAALVDDLLSVAALVFLVGALVFARLFHIRRKAEGAGSPGWRRELAGLLVLLVLVGVAVAVVRRRAEVAAPSPPPLAALPRTGDASPARRPSEAAERYDPSFRWLPVAIAAGLGAAVAAALLAARARRRARLREGEPPSLEQDLSLLLDEALDDLRRERDVRRAIVAAYARMERLLAAHGLPRRRWEAPLEYLDRVLGELSASRGSVARLTRLFERAKFGRGDLAAGTKDEAIGALETLRAELGSAT
jgi:hypothetical protein